MDAETYATILIECDNDPAAAARLIASLYGVYAAFDERTANDPRWLGGAW